MFLGTAGATTTDDSWSLGPGWNQAWTTPCSFGNVDAVVAVVPAEDLADFLPSMALQELSSASGSGLARRSRL